MPFQKGQSGNPGGRPRELEDLKVLARTHTEAAVAALAAALENPKERVGAATALLDRGYGKPRQVNEVSGQDGRPLMIITGADASMSNGLRDRLLAGFLPDDQRLRAHPGLKFDTPTFSTPCSNARGGDTTLLG